MANKIPSENVGVLKQLTEKYGLGKELYSAMLEKKDAWRKEKISIAVVGPSRIGKSSHINAHMNKKVAQVSATKQCTMQCTPYPHPMNPNIILWDVPGVNTLDFDRENYDEKIDFDQYDFFLILTDNIFTDDTKWLTDQIQDRGKSYYLVRTKVDYAVREALEDCDDGSLMEEDIVAEIRQTLNEDLERLGFKDKKFKVYLVNNKNKTHFDFAALEKDICLDSYSEFQQEALMITIGSHNKQLLEAKNEMFKNRIWKVALASAAGGAVPVPGVSAAVDLGIIIEEVLIYYSGFGLDKSSIRALEQLVGYPAGDIEASFSLTLKTNYPILYAIRENSPYDLADPKTIKDALPALTRNLVGVIMPQMGLMAVSEGVEDITKYALPVLGLALAAAISYGTTAYQLRLLLSQMMEVARIVHNMPTDQQAKRLDRLAITD